MSHGQISIIFGSVIKNKLTLREKKLLRAI